MKRTRKWAFVAQEAIRLAGLGLSPLQIAQQIGVKRSTVQRWMAAGKLSDTRRGQPTAAKRTQPRSVAEVTKRQTPAEWAATVRQDFALDASDDQLVTLAEAALGKALDPLEPVPVRLQATRTFQGLVKQLALVARAAAVSPKPDAPTITARQVRPRGAGDPRAILAIVQ